MRRTAFLALSALLTAGLVTTQAPSPAGAATPRSTARLTSASLGYDRIGVRRGGDWLLRSSLSGGPADRYSDGPSGWLPVAGDTGGTGTGTVSLMKDGLWQIGAGKGNGYRSTKFGLKGDLPVLGNWDGTGVWSLGVFRAGGWYLRAVGGGPVRHFGFGQPGDIPVVGDWTGSGRTGIGVVRGRQWFERDSASGGPANRSFVFGLPGDQPVAGDWDHDGVDTPGVFRGGTWFFHDSNGPGGTQTARFGLPGDRPVVRRVPGLSNGVTHQVLRDPSGPFVVHIATIDPRGPASPDAVLANGALGGVETTSSMALRTGAALAVNGDYALDSGRPVHAFAADGRLAQTEQVRGRAVGFDLNGHVTGMGFPTTQVSVTPAGAASATPVAQWNAGPPSGDALAGFTPLGGTLETPPANACYAGLNEVSRPIVHPGGGLEQTLQVTGTRCGGNAPVVPAGGLVLVANQASAGETFVRGLVVGQEVSLATAVGFPNSVDLVGGNPLLVSGGAIPAADVDGSGGFFDRNPRTIVGSLSDGRILLVVVDGRAPGYSVGMTLREAANLMVSLGAQDAINLDGGGSSTMWLNGLVANRPSDGVERGVSSALVVLPSADPSLAGIVVGSPAPSPSPSASPGVAARRPAVTRQVTVLRGDPGSTSGLLRAFR